MRARLKASPAWLVLVLVPAFAANAVVLSRPSAPTGPELRERAMALVNVGQQISAAQAINALRTGSMATDVAQLVKAGELQDPDSLSADGGSRLARWGTDGRYAYVGLDGDTRALCAEIGRQASGSRSGTNSGVGAGGDQFGCVSDSGPMRFVFRIQ